MRRGQIPPAHQKTSDVLFRERSYGIEIFLLDPMNAKTAIVLFVLLLVGCSTTVNVGMLGQSDMNGGGNAAVVRIYELSGEGSFMEASFRTFWQGDGGALKGVLVGSREQTVFPGESEQFELELAEETNFIGVAANFRNPQEDGWRGLYSVDEVGDRLSVTVHSNRISVDVEGGGVIPVLGMRSRRSR